MTLEGATEDQLLSHDCYTDLCSKSESILKTSTVGGAKERMGWNLQEGFSGCSRIDGRRIAHSTKLSKTLSAPLICWPGVVRANPSWEISEPDQLQPHRIRSDIRSDIIVQETTDTRADINSMGTMIYLSCSNIFNDLTPYTSR